MTNTLISQLIALTAFFAFPIIQYLVLKYTSRKYARPELWYLPDHGYRVVIRNMFSKKMLSNIRQQVFIREYIQCSEGSSVASYEDEFLSNEESMFQFPKTDQILLEFQLSLDGEHISLVRRNKKGKMKKRHILFDDAELIIDYQAHVENWFNFNVKVCNRVKLNETTLFHYHQETEEDNVERQFDFDEINRFV